MLLLKVEYLITLEFGIFIIVLSIIENIYKLKAFEISVYILSVVYYRQ